MDPHTDHKATEMEDIHVETQQRVSHVDLDGYSIFLFVNPTSGGNKAKVVTNLDVTIKMNVPFGHFGIFKKETDRMHQVF